MSSSDTSSPFQGARFWRILIYTTLIVFACMYLLPLFVMLVTSFKELDEIRQGNMLALPEVWTVEPWVSAWGTACIGLTCEGISGYFTNSIMITVPGVLLSTTLGALNGYVLTKWRFRGHRWVFGLMLFGCFIPFQVVLVPMSQVLGTLGLANTTAGLVLVHAIYGLGFTTLFFRNYYEAFPSELIRAAMIDGAGFFRMFFRILLPSSGPIIVVTIIWQFTNIWNDFLFGASFASGDTAPITVALNNLVNSSTGVKEYNVHMAGAMIAALPTLLVYILAGRYFVRGLMAGSVKG
ncbi:carbohydrate ABC transporter permease [Enterovibrio baiacu]|uniref:carbohydrate ABC transporter permease n=1 Tax=Enterovibrio baiacu TaxID=2491023 RepID=UPI0010104E36|nr:carbohydrate ABC transporter permease [Enterovibrio baiacu]MBE1276963.1 carbohydrate ABC transporter permease [Enterovibrio baiacu]